ncbi:hypothetical protein [Burkholderia ubonensis]|uniref:hypothetical protein n=1 Tax=Burkholderia ubonensis TaxID=101571 RepID=UPI00075850FE|nr:hypothetical protein [Burkholderia ubonensis]KUZ76924.1 hypothetical protein WI37_16235 [Burkholderia ubonensis]
MDQEKFSLLFRLALLGAVVILGGAELFQFLNRDEEGSSTAATKCTIDRRDVESSADGRLVVKKGARIACDGVPGRGTAYQVSK